jgi:N-acetylglutamate synthase/N-acetylornithine aminotransferase
MSAPVAAHTRSGICAPLGFRGGVAAAGIRGDGDEIRTDLAVIRSDTPAAAAGVFTRNTVKAAPVHALALPALTTMAEIGVPRRRDSVTRW